VLLLRALFLRPARARPLRLLATVLGVAAGVAALVSTRVSSRAAVGALGEGVLELAGPARLEVLADGGVDTRLLGTLAPLAGELCALPVVDEVVLCPRLSDTLRLIGVDLLSDSVAARLEFDALSQLGPGAPAAAVRGLGCQGVWISRALAAELGLEPGGRFELLVRSRAVELEVLGLFAPRGGARVFDHAVLLDVACAQELLRTPGRITRLELVPRGPMDVEDARERVQALLPASARVRAPEQRADAVRELSRSLEFDLDMIALISLVVGGVLVAISLATAVVQRRQVLALCVSLGASRAQLAGVLACEALVVGTLGGALGVLLGWGAARLSAPAVRATLSNVVGPAPSGAIALQAGDALFGVVLGALCALVAALLPIHEARRTPPVQNLRRERPSELGAPARRRALAATLACIALACVCTRIAPWNGLPIPALAGTFALQAALLCALGPLFELVGHAGARAAAHSRVGILMRLALAALAAGRRRAVWAAGAVGVAVSLSIAIATMVGSFRGTVEAWTARAFTADYWIRPQVSALGGPVGRLDPGLVELAERLYGPAAVDPFHVASARVNGAEVQLAAGAFEVVRTRGIMAFVDGRSPRAVFEQACARHEVIVSEALALRFGLEAGDTLRFEAAGRTLSKGIAGVARDFGDSRGQIILDRPEFLELFPGDAPQQIALFLPAGCAPAEVRRRLFAALDPDLRIELISVADLRQRILEVFERTFAITRAMEAVAAGVAVVAVLTVLFALLSERRAEVGILRALGASAAQVSSTVGLQAGLLGGVGASVGAAAGLAIGWIVVAVVHPQSFRWTLDFDLPWLVLVETLVAVTLVCAAAGLWPALVAARWSPRELLREEA
jgi:putative ABC transport system permease protein